MLGSQIHDHPPGGGGAAAAGRGLSSPAAQLAASTPATSAAGTRRFVRRVSFDNYQPETAVLSAAPRKLSSPGPLSTSTSVPSSTCSPNSELPHPITSAASGPPATARTGGSSAPLSSSTPPQPAHPPLPSSAAAAASSSSSPAAAASAAGPTPGPTPVSAAPAPPADPALRQKHRKPTSILKSGHGRAAPAATAAADKASGSRARPAGGDRLSSPCSSPPRLDPDASAHSSPPARGLHPATTTTTPSISVSSPNSSSVASTNTSSSLSSLSAAKGGRPANSLTTPAPSARSSSTSTTTSNSTTSNAVSNYNTLQPTNTGNNLRKKSYSEMSDSELLALDSQFNVRTVDIQKSYGFAVGPRLSASPFTNSDKDPLENSGSFKNLSPNAILNEYPTKPIITKNSICFNYKHADLKNSDLNDKFYLILLSSKSYSLSSLDYYINKISSKGDTIVICCSLSTSILGNDKNEMLDEFIDSFTNLILSHLENSPGLVHPINITFEFFKSGAFFAEVFNLYQPSLIIVGTNNAKTKSTSMTTANRKLLSVVYVGNDQIINPPSSECSTENGDSWVKSNNAQVTFKMPFKAKEEAAASGKATPKIVVDPPHISHTISHSSMDSNSSDSNNKLSKMKTNDTQASSLFDNLNDTPLLDLCKTNSNSTNTSYDFLKTDSTCDSQRRRSMLDVLNPDTLLSKSPSNDDSNQCAIDDSDEGCPEQNRLTQLGRRTSRSSSGSFETPKPLTGHEKQKQELFEKYQRRLSAVKVGPQAASKSSPSKTPATPVDGAIPSDETTNDTVKSTNSNKKNSPKGSESRSIFKKWFK